MGMVYRIISKFDLDFVRLRNHEFVLIKQHRLFNFLFEKLGFKFGKYEPSYLRQSRLLDWG